jgi:hypothetical protein
MVGLSAVSSVQALELARHPFAATAEISRRTVTGAPLEVAHPAILTGAQLAGRCNNRGWYRANGNSRRENTAFIVRTAVYRVKGVRMEKQVENEGG